ncbi:MAG: AraC family transcriptional regulator [Pyrinomonadaceae bacterium]|nr:AraC family transcriptional regulator [Pyrinomonadaceae bacterium]
MDGRIFHLCDCIFRDLKKSWTIEQMAEITELSVPHFQKLFKAQIGSPPITYLRDLRLEKAREFLEVSFHQIKQIGIEVGMPDDSHFTRDFKKKYGVTPTEYRNQYWQKIQVEQQNG